MSFLPRYASETEKDAEMDLPIWHQYGMGLRTADSELFTRGSSPTGQGVRRRTFDPEAVLADVGSRFELGPARNPPKTNIYDLLPFLIVFKPLVSLAIRVTTGHGSTDGDRTITGKRKKPAHIDSNVPLEVMLYLNSYLSWLLKENLLAPVNAAAFSNALVALQDSVANLDRVRNTPCVHIHL